MALKTERLEARLSVEDRALIERAAAATGVSVSGFLVAAAVRQADEIVATHSRTVVPSDYFDTLLAALDEPDEAPRLRQAGRDSTRLVRITRR